MREKSIFDVISPIMIGPSSSHTAGAIRIGLLAREIYNKTIKKAEFILYNSYAKTKRGHGTDKGLLAGILGYKVDDIQVKNIFDTADIEYSFSTVEDISRHPNSVDILINDSMKISGDSTGAGDIKIISINDFSVTLTGKYHTILLMYKDQPGMISNVSKLIQDKKINIASLQCDRNEKGGIATMCLALDAEPETDIIDDISRINDVYFVTKIRKIN